MYSTIEVTTLVLSPQQQDFSLEFKKKTELFTVTLAEL